MISKNLEISKRQMTVVWLSFMFSSLSSITQYKLVYAEWAIRCADRSVEIKACSSRYDASVPPFLKYDQLQKRPIFRHNIYISSILVNRGYPAKFSLIWRGTIWMGIIHYTHQSVKHVRQQFWQASHQILKHPYLSCQTTTSRALWDYTLNIFHLWPRT